MMLFTPLTIGQLTIRNRVATAPISGNQANPDGSLGPEVVEFYDRIARGGVGLVVTGAFQVRPFDRSSRPGLQRRFYALSSEELIPGLRAVTDAVHAGGAAIFAQLSSSLGGLAPADASIEQVHALRDAIIAGAERARRAGCDGVELHACHVAGLADFLSRALNHRSDEYGRGVEGRARLICEIISGIRDLLGPDFPVSCRFCADECMMGGNTVQDTTRLARMFVAAGAAMISVSAGGRRVQGGEYSYLRAWPMHDWPDAMNAYLGEEIKRAVDVPVVIAGKIGTPQVAEAVLERGQADLVALGRALVADPEWANKARDGRLAEIDYCLYCRYCRDSTMKGEPVRCVKTPPAG